MGNLGKYLILLGAVGMAGIGSISEDAQANTSSDELYSETIYIQKSSAEVPTSLESNGRAGSEEAVVTSENRTLESVSDLDTAPVAKKISHRNKR